MGSTIPYLVHAELFLGCLARALFSTALQCRILSAVEQHTVSPITISCSSAPRLKCFGRSQRWTAQLHPRVKPTIPRSWWSCLLPSTGALSGIRCPHHNFHITINITTVIIVSSGRSYLRYGALQCIGAPLAASNMWLLQCSQSQKRKNKEMQQLSIKSRNIDHMTDRTNNSIRPCQHRNCRIL